MESTVMTPEPSSEERPAPKRTYADHLRRLADWIDQHEVPDVEISSCGLDLIHVGPAITLRGHERLTSVYQGHQATLAHNGQFDELMFRADGIHFRGWKRREDIQPQQSEVTL